ncbi:MAG: GDP-mannose 4,6-dehydratase [Candidatus Eisenbacteria bacterium]|nr:GDP-mannose 4,6-dehydratase [Candidatus Eisenbacteria bacterium]
MIEKQQWALRHVLVTGGAGFIGSHLVEQLTKRGTVVTVVDDLSAGRRENLVGAGGRAHLKQADIRQLRWEELLGEQSYDVIFHLAANAYVPPSVERPAWDYGINLAGTFQLLEALRQMRWPGALIYASSAAVYGEPVRMPIQEEDATVPISPYGVAKLAAERYIAVYSQLYGLRAASMRFFSVYGPRQRKQVVYDLIQKVVRNPTELPIYGDGTQTRDFNYVDDTARAMILAAECASLQGETYNVASGRECSIRELAEIICGILRAQPRFIYSGSIRPGDPEKWKVNLDRLTTLGYRPQVTMEEGVRRTADWILGSSAH